MTHAYSGVKPLPSFSPTGLDHLPYSRECGTLKRSVMRDLLSYASMPGMISLAGGLPATDSLPLIALSECLQTVLTRDGARLLQYNPPYAPLREWLADWMRHRGVEVSPDEIFITNGNQQSLTILSRLFLDAGDVAVIEDATFTGIQQVTAGRGALLRTIPVDLQTGVDIVALETAFATEPRPRLAILIPDFHNPLGVSLSLEKRQTIAALSARYGVPIIEDDPYSALRFEGAALPAIKAFDENESIFYLGSFSKMLAPSLRLGWMVIPKHLSARIATIRESIDLESSALMQRAVYEFLSQGLLPAHLEQLNRVHGERRNALLDALQTELSDHATWTQPQGGLFSWLTLNHPTDTTTLFDRAVQQQVIYIPGGAFSADGDHRASMRLNFSSASPSALREGVRRLATVIRENRS